MLKRIPAIVALALMLVISPAFAATQITFSDDQMNADPGFRITPGPQFSRLEFGSLAGNDGLDFLRIQSPDNGMANSIRDYIIVFPRFDMVPAVIPGADCAFSLFPNPITGANFAIYAPNFAGPLVTGNIRPGGLAIFGASGQMYSDINFADLAIIGAAGGLPPDLQAFVSDALIGGVDVSGTMASSDIVGICPRIAAGQVVEGSANGDLSTIPEPGTVMLLIAGGLGLIRRRQS